MIETKLHVKDRCHNCPKFEPVLSVSRIYADSGIVSQRVHIDCENQSLCTYLEAFVIGGDEE